MRPHPRLRSRERIGRHFREQFTERRRRHHRFPEIVEIDKAALNADPARFDLDEAGLGPQLLQRLDGRGFGTRA
jgi:hypothetical protein